MFWQILRDNIYVFVPLFFWSPLFESIIDLIYTDVCRLILDWILLLEGFGCRLLLEAPHIVILGLPKGFFSSYTTNKRSFTRGHWINMGKTRTRTNPTIHPKFSRSSISYLLFYLWYQRTNLIPSRSLHTTTINCATK